VRKDRATELQEEEPRSLLARGGGDAPFDRATEWGAPYGGRWVGGGGMQSAAREPDRTRLPRTGWAALCINAFDVVFLLS
jgi:hypothetical protein